MKKEWKLTPEEIAHDVAIFEELKKVDTPTITNVVATYPKSKTCLRLYNPWYGKWYTDQTCRCMFPEMGPRVGYAVTATYGMPERDFGYGTNIGTVFEAIKEAPKPSILCVKQDMPEEIKRINGLMGGNMITAFKNAGIVGAISDGASRDIDEVRKLGIQYMLTGVTAGHGAFSLQAVNDPVEICGMVVSPGDIVHMDENGAVRFPREYLDDVLRLSKELLKAEANQMRLLAKAQTPQEVNDIMAGKYN